LSIEHFHFQAVFGLFGAGTFDDAEALQALARVRPTVPRHVWCSPVVLPKEKPISSAWWPAQVEAELRQRWQEQSQRLRQELQPDVFSAEGKAQELLDLAIEQWSIVQSRRNYSLAHLRAFIKARLKHEGHQLNEHQEPIEQAEAKALDELRKELKEDRQAQAAKALLAAPAISKQQADDLQRRQFLLPEQQASLQKRVICERLAIEPQKLTVPLIQWADQWAAAARRLAMLLLPDMAKLADMARLKATTPSGQAPLPFDQSFKGQEVAAAEALGLRAFIVDHALALKSWNSDTPEAIGLADKARRHAIACKQAFGLTISDKDSTVAIVGKLLKHYGLTTTTVGSSRTRRTYQADLQQLSLVVATAKRLQEQALMPGTSPGLVNKTRTGASDQPRGASHEAEASDLLPHPPIRSTTGGRSFAHQPPLACSGVIPHLPNSFITGPVIPSGAIGGGGNG
jgi:hypothetical protein